VPRGSYLVIENLDRLSRETERTALRLWLDILDSGINIVQLQPETVFRHERSDMTDIIRAIIELSRGHSESRIKSVRTLANWEKAYRLAREGVNQPPRRKDGRVTRSITSRLPGWIQEINGRLELIPERAQTVRRIFEMARAGYGANAIVRKLVAEKVPAFGGRLEDEEGHYKAAAGERYGCGEWRTSYVRNILSDRRALGEFQPRDAHERRRGDPIPDYYPAVVTPEEFYPARAAVTQRKNKGSDNGVAVNRQGRIGKGVANLFGGLLRNARDGSTYYAASRSENGTVSKVLLNKSSIEGHSKAYTFPYGDFERALLSKLREIDPAEIVNPVPETSVSVLQGELNWIRERRATLALELLKGEVAEVADALRQLKVREDELVAQLDHNTEMTIVPRADSWRDMQSLVDLLDQTPEADREDVRLRLRGALRRIVSGVWVLVVPRALARLCAVSVFFGDGGVRHYLILRKQAVVNPSSRKPGGCWVDDFKALALDSAGLDLHQRDHAADLERVLLALDLDDLMKVMTPL